MAVLVRRGKVKLIGYVQNAAGRDVKLFARNPVNKPQHEYEVTELLLGVHAELMRRGYSVDSHHADAEITINGILVYLEHDRGTMGYAELIERVNKYIDCENIVLWVMSSETRIKGLLERTESLPETFLFTTYEQARQNFHGDVWQNAYGVTSCVERSVMVPVDGHAGIRIDEGMATSRAGNPL